LKKDTCPNGDFSSSYYDGVCGAGDQEPSHNAPSEKLTGQTIYERAKEQGLTSMSTFESFRPDVPITRAEMTKVIVAFITASKASLSGETSDLPALSGAKDEMNIACRSFSDLNEVSTDLQSYIIKACELGLMGYYSDGQTVKSEFKPNETITLAEVAITVSRWLRGNLYKGSEQRRYHSHLLALQKVGLLSWGVNPMENGKRETIYTIFYTLRPFLPK
jgi:hypothetical protein